MRRSLLSAALAIAACGHAPTATRRHFAITPGTFAEANLTMRAGAIVTADFAASAPLRWNVHSHAGGETIIHAKGEGASGAIRFTAPKGGVFSYLWEAPKDARAPIDLDVTLRGDASVKSWHP